MLKIVGWIIFAVGSWMLVSPQAVTGLAQLKWMYKYAFPGEVLLGIVVMLGAYYLIGMAPAKKPDKPGH